MGRASRKLEREKVRKEYKELNLGIEKKYRGFFQDQWEKHQIDKFGKKEHAILKFKNKRKRK